MLPCELWAHIPDVEDFEVFKGEGADSWGWTHAGCDEGTNQERKLQFSVNSNRLCLIVPLHGKTVIGSTLSRPHDSVSPEHICGHRETLWRQISPVCSELPASSGPNLCSAAESNLMKFLLLLLTESGLSY